MPETTLTPKEQFRLGFLLKCAELGLSANQIRERVEHLKRAQFILPPLPEAAKPATNSAADVARALLGATLAGAGKEKRAGWEDYAPGIGGLAKLFTGYPWLAGTLALAAGPVLGAATGYTAAKATEHRINPEDAKKYELIAAYQQQAERARRNAARVSFRPAAPRTRSPQLV